MNREEFKKLAEEEFINNTMKHLDSALIFTYKQNLEQKANNLQSKIDKAIEFVESMGYCGQEGYFYDKKSKDPCGNDNTFNDSKYKLLDILKEE